MYLTRPGILVHGQVVEPEVLLSAPRYWQLADVDPAIQPVLANVKRFVEAHRHHGMVGHDDGYDLPGDLQEWEEEVAVASTRPGMPDPEQATRQENPK